MNQPIEFLTPVGRIVQGDCFKGKTTNPDGTPLVFKNGPNAGQPCTNFFIALAIPKNDPGWPELWAKMNAAAKAGYPQFFDTQGQCTNAQFSWKYRDGDSTQPNSRGIKPCDCQGFPGNHILNFSSNFPFPVYKRVNGKVVETTSSEDVKRGFFVQIKGSTKDNSPSQSPGIYLNLEAVMFIAYGEEIRNGPDGEAIFGVAPIPALPPGASATPLAPATTPPAGMTPGGTPGASPSAPQGASPVAGPGTPQTTPAGGTVAPTNTAAVQPVPSFVQPTAGTAPAPVEERYQTDQGVFTCTQLEGYGWIPEQINATPRVQ